LIGLAAARGEIEILLALEVGDRGCQSTPSIADSRRLEGSATRVPPMPAAPKSGTSRGEGAA
jgi:hypothetical protein